MKDSAKITYHRDLVIIDLVSQVTVENTAGSFLLDTFAATEILARQFAAELRLGDVLALQGDLGTGKTTLARAIIRSMTANPNLSVPSPTFTLVQHYAGQNVRIAHYDWYRLSKPEDVLELGWEEDLATAVTFVEWPERAACFLPAHTRWLMLDMIGEDRRARF